MSLKVTSGSLEGQVCVFTDGNKMFLPLLTITQVYDLPESRRRHALTIGTHTHSGSFAVYNLFVWVQLLYDKGYCSKKKRHTNKNKLN